MIEDIHVVESHSLKTLVKACNQILAAAPVAVWSLPHIIACLWADNELVAVCRQMLLKDKPEVLLCAAVFRAIVVCQVKVGDAVVKGCEAHLLHVVV